MTAKKVMGNVIKIPACRLSFPDLEEAKAFEEGQIAKFGVMLLLDPKNPVHARKLAEMQVEEERMILEAWGEAPAKLVLEYTGSGNDRTNMQSGEIYQGYEGMVFIACKNTNQPLLIDTERNILPKGDKGIVGGMYANATINLFCQENKYGKAIRASIRGVQALGYGEPFGSRVSDEEFADFDSDDDGVGAPDDDGL